MSPRWLDVIFITFSTKSHWIKITYVICCVLNHIYMWPRLLKNMYVLSSFVVISLIATSCRIHTDLSRWFQAMHAILTCLESVSTLITGHGNHEVTMWPSATHSHGDDSLSRHSWGSCFITCLQQVLYIQFFCFKSLTQQLTSHQSHGTGN